MSKTLKTIEFKNFLPSSIASDKQFIAAGLAIDKVLKDIEKDIEKIFIISRLNQIEEPFLSEIAYQFLIAGWHNELTNEQKRALIRQSIFLHSKKGTKYAVEQVLNLLGYTAAENVKITEWFEYAGAPYTFRLQIENANFSISAKKIKKLLQAIKNYKNTRSLLETVRNIRTRSLPLKFVGVFNIRKKITVLEKKKTGQLQKIAYNFFSAFHVKKIIEIK